MPVWLPIPFLVACVIFLLRAETARPRDLRGVRLWKPAATAMAIAAALLALPQARSVVYVVLVAIGLIACLVGDVFLIDGDRPEMFARGLAAFLIGHLIFIGAFTAVQQSNMSTTTIERELAVGAVLAVLVALLYLYMREGMGEMRGPVLVYMVVIALMVHRAVAGLDLAQPLPSQGALAAGGALLFLVSDAILALNRFVFPSDPIDQAGPAAASSDGRDRIWVLTTYYAAIAMIAASCAL
jgi:uncharacterized membrane protein YhhN